MWADEFTVWPTALDDEALKALTALESLTASRNLLQHSQQLDAATWAGSAIAQPVSPNQANNAWPYGHIPSSYTPRYAPWGDTIRKVVANIHHKMGGTTDHEEYWVGQYDRRLNYQPTDDEVMATCEALSGRGNSDRIARMKGWLVSARLAEDITVSMFKQGQYVVEQAEAAWRRVQLEMAAKQRDMLRRLMMNSPTYIVTQDRLKNLIGDAS